LCWPLFGTEYLNDLGSVEGNFISFAKFLGDRAPHVAFLPLFDAGLPIENAYLPMVPALTALGSVLTRTSPAHAFHFLAALAYCERTALDLTFSLRCFPGHPRRPRRVLRPAAPRHHRPLRRSFA
jgi:hypothetical protein